MDQYFWVVFANYRCPRCQHSWHDVLMVFHLDQNCSKCNLSLLPIKWVWNSDIFFYIEIYFCWIFRFIEIYFWLAEIIFHPDFFYSIVVIPKKLFQNWFDFNSVCFFRFKFNVNSSAVLIRKYGTNDHFIDELNDCGIENGLHDRIKSIIIHSITLDAITFRHNVPFCIIITAISFNLIYSSMAPVTLLCKIKEVHFLCCINQWNMAKNSRFSMNYKHLWS